MADSRSRTFYRECSASFVTGVNYSYLTTVCFPTDIDECVTQTDNCSEYATCSNTVGSYDCVCFDGFDGDGFVCIGKL